LLVDGRRVERKQVDLPPQGEASVGFTHRFDKRGDHAIDVLVAGDRLEVDNHRWMVVPIRQSVRVLCINGRPSGERLRGAADYLAFALSPEDRRGQQGPVQVDVAAESALLERDLARYDCVFLCDVAQFTANESRVLAAYLAAGGNLVFFLGDQVLPERYNRELIGRKKDQRLLPAELDTVAEAAQYRLDPLDYRHPIVEPFRGRRQAGLLSIWVNRYFKLKLPEDSSARVVLATAGGDPLIVEEPIGRGRVVLVATSADLSWTPMPLWPSYVPLVQEILAWCLGSQLQQRNVEVKQPLEGSIPVTDGSGILTITQPDEASREIRLQSNGDYRTFSFAETMLGGIYEARAGSLKTPPQDPVARFAVNLDTAESDLAKLDEDELLEDVWPGTAVVYQTTFEDLDEPVAGPIVRKGHLHVDLLYVALALLLLETFLAWRFGYHTT